MTCKWLITMVSFRPLNGVMGPLTNGRFMAYKWGLLSGMILQVWCHAGVKGLHETRLICRNFVTR